MSPQEQIADLQGRLANQSELMARKDMLIASLQADKLRLTEALTMTQGALHVAELALQASAETSEGVTELLEATGDAAEPTPVTRTHSYARRPQTLREKLAEHLAPHRVRAAALAGVLTVTAFLGASFGNNSADVAQGRVNTNATPAAKTNASAKSGSGAAGKSTTSSSTSTSQSPDAKALAKAESDYTVAEFLHDIQGDHQSTKSIIKAIFAETHTQRLDHDKGSMSSLRAEFQNRILSSRDYAIAVADSVKGSDGFALKEHDVITGSADSGVTPDQARQTIEDIMTAPGTTFSVEQPGGTFLNHGQKGENVFDAGIVSLTKDVQSVFVIRTEGGLQLYFKVFNNNCVNILTPVTIELPAPVVEQVVATPAPVVPEQPGHPQPRVPRRHRHGGRPHNRVVPGTPGTPVTPPGGPPPVVPPHKIIPGKHDNSDSHNVTGNTGESSGTGVISPATGPGVGNAGQPSNPNGTVTGEAPPPTQAPDSTPTPIATQPAPASGGERSPDNGQNQAPSSSNSSAGTTITPGATAPTT
jgi:hypothetical protein